MAGATFEARRQREPSDQSDERSANSGDGSDEQSVGDDDQAKMSIRCTDGRDHAELAQAALRHHDEAGSRDQRHEQEHDRSEHQDHGRSRGLLGRTPAAKQWPCRCPTP